MAKVLVADYAYSDIRNRCITLIFRGAHVAGMATKATLFWTATGSILTGVGIVFGIVWNADSRRESDQERRALERQALAIERLTLNTAVGEPVVPAPPPPAETARETRPAERERPASVDPLVAEQPSPPARIPPQRQSLPTEDPTITTVRTAEPAQLEWVYEAR